MNSINIAGKFYKNRGIETFELTSQYYETSFICGNKKHVSEELSELFIFYPMFFVQIFIELPKHIQSHVTNSDLFISATNFIQNKLNH